jgi:cytochrome o ubiquinol oxidase subunit 2
MLYGMIRAVIMRGKYKVAILLLATLALILLASLYLHHQNIAVLNPKGPIAMQERNLMFTVVLLMLIVVVPVFGLTFFIAWRYRAGNTHARYQPEWDHSRLLEAIWWLIPSILILVLSVITWNATHNLTPTKPLTSSNPAITIQAVALDWKWLFIYPKQNIATVNYVQFPVNTPINFEITADAPMNSFWIPQLGGQIYAMAGMSTSLHLMATGLGTFRGSSANISGRGFAGMEFNTRSSSQPQFESWVNGVKRSSATLNDQTYATLALPSQDNPYQSFSVAEVGLYDKIILQYMSPSEQELALQQTQSLGEGGP